MTRLVLKTLNSLIGPCAFGANEYVVQVGGAVPRDGVIGWIEKDGVDGNTSENETLLVDSTIEQGVVVHVDCNNW